MKHYLLTLPLGDQWAMHAYVMTSKQAKLRKVTGLMLERAEARGLNPSVPVLMVTELDDISLVRSIVEQNPQSAQLLQSAQDFHFTIWLMPKDDPQFDRLMELH